MRVLPGVLLPITLWGFRIFNESTDFFEPVFSPHQKGTVGYYGEPTNLKRERVNEGAAGTTTFPRQAEDVKARQNCLNMVGPLGDGKYYCRGKEYGYCDRRSGTCFCNQGYQGLDCFKCSPTHDRRGTLCYPKKSCPNDCSGAGDCDYATGTCKCQPHRSGPDCLLRVCQKFHQFCTECTDSTCVRCTEGWFVNSSVVSNACVPCTVFDPRCTVCDKGACLHCGDPLLLSVRRSGRRRQDPLLPYDELTRDLSQQLPFGSQHPGSFDEAEYFHLSSNTKPLHETAMECSYWVPDLYICDLQSKKYPHCDIHRTGSPDQVEHSNWGCSDWSVSHAVCGNAGTVSFSSPSYAVEESSGFVQLTVRRSGGGMGEVRVQFALRHRSTDSSDVSLSAYKAQQTLTFKEGVVQLSFIITIHDDLIREPDESFTVTLRSPTGGAVLGPQKSAVVTIMDDDAPKTRPNFCTADKLKLVNTAGQTNHFQIQAVSASRLLQNRGADRFEVEVINTPLALVPDIAPHPSADGIGITSAASGRPMPMSMSGGANRRGQAGNIASSRIPPTHGARSSTKQWVVGNTSTIDNHDGTYACTWQVDRQGVYSVMVRQAVPYGLVGEYFDNIYLQGSPVFTRVDNEINFQWGHGRITTNGADFAGVRWRGKVQGPHTGVTTFEVIADDHARLWVDGVLLVDRWDVKCGAARGKISLEKHRLYDLVLEYRELRGAAEVQLRWCYLDNCEPQHVHAKYLFQMHHIAGSPFPNIQVRPTTTSAYHSVARGVGLWQAVAGVTTHFEIYPRDEFGNQQQSNIAVADPFHANAKMATPDKNGDPEGSPSTSSPTYPISLIYNKEAMQQTDEDCHQPVGKGTTPVTQSLECRRGVTGDKHYSNRFVAQYTPEISGIYDLSVMLGATNEHIYGSPFRVQVSPAHTSALVSRVWGAGLREGTTGELALLRIEAHDIFGNLRQEQEGQDLFELQAYHDGTPTYVHDDLAEGQQAQDAAWSSRRSLPEVVVGTVHPVATSPGTYDAAFRPLLKGIYKVAVTLNGLHVAESPYTLVVQTSAVEPRACPAWGQNIATATSQIEGTFEVEIRDAFNNQIVDGGGAGFAPAVTLTGTTIPNDSPLSSVAPKQFGNCIYQSNKYKCSYTPTSAGRHKLAVRIRNRHIRGSPFTVMVSPGDTSGDTSTASGQGLYSGRAGDVSRFVVQAKDVSYNNKRLGGDSFQATLTYYDGAVAGINSESSGGESAQIISSNPQFLDDGRYEFTYTPIVRGNYKLEVSLNGKHVIGSPFYPYVSPSHPSAVHSILSGAGMQTGEAGYLSRVVVDLHDRFDNHLEFGGAQLVAKYVHLGGHGMEKDVQPQYAHVHDFGNGSYDLSYTPLRAGKWRAEISMWTPGGLNASLHNTADDDPQLLYQKKSLVLQSVDTSIHFDWSTKSYAPAGESVAQLALRKQAGMVIPYDHWGGRWQGKLRAQHSENFTFYLTTSPDDGARLMVGGEVLIDAWKATSSTSSMHAASLPLRAGYVYTIEVQYRDLLGPASLKLEWESASNPREVVPSGALYRLLRIGDHEPVADVIPTITSAAACFAGGDGLVSATASVQASFTIHSRDIFDNERLDGADLYRVVGTGNGPDHFDGEVVDRGDGSYEVTYTPTAVGHYSLAVTYNAPTTHRDLSAYQVAQSLLHSHIKGSPFSLHVHPGVTDGSSSTAFGSGLLSCVAGQTASFTIQSKDTNHNNRDTGVDQWKVALRGPSDVAGSAANIAGTAVAKSMGEGKYESLYTPVVAGVYTLAVTLDGNHVIGSPFRTYVSPAKAHGPSCKAKGSALSAAVADGEAKFTVTAADAFGNKLTEAGDAFVARLYGPQSQDILLVSRSPRSGEYVGSYKVAAGQYELSIALANSPTSAQGPASSKLRSGGGLVGYYYNNQWLRGSAEHSQVDPSIAFDWGEGPITFAGSDLVSVRWAGYIKAEFSEDYTFTVDVDHAVRLIVGGVVVVDTSSHAATSDTEIGGEFSNTTTMEAGVLKDIIVEYREDRGPAHLSLYWSSNRLAKEIVPPSLLFPGSSAIEGSPFSITVT